MNRFIKTSITSGIAALAVVASIGAAPALARSHSSHDYFRHSSEGSGDGDMATPNVPTAGSGSYFMWPTAAPSDAAAIDQQIRHLPAGRFAIAHVNLTGPNSSAGVIGDRATEPRYLANLHRSIDNNRPLLARLEAQNVEIRNVIGAEPAGDGSMTFYVE